jgi:hypothetical protein
LVTGAQSAPLFEEDFEGPAFNYILEGEDTSIAGSKPRSFWGLRSQTNDGDDDSLPSTDFTAFDGDYLYGQNATDLSVDDPSVTFPVVDLTGITGTQLVLDIATPSGGFEGNPDMLTLELDKDNDGAFETTLFTTNQPQVVDGVAMDGSFKGFSFAIPDDATETVLRIRWDTSNDDGEAFGFDNVRIVPEPTTMALLGLGGLAVLRRRRR